MRRFCFALLLCACCFAAGAQPRTIHVGGQTHHVQGIAYDAGKGRLYLSFTTRFIVADTLGNILGSIDRIDGHLGAITFDPRSRCVYGTLEHKNDVIGSYIARTLGGQDYTHPVFYVAKIDVDAVTATGTPQQQALHYMEVVPAGQDHLAEVTLGDRTVRHRYGCSGIDGITVAPGFGCDKGEYLYVAYGVYSDVDRTDNDHQVLLQYSMRDVRKGRLRTPRKFFIHTGNTNFGVQNLAYDAHSGLLLMAVYKGKKTQYENRDLYAVRMASRPRRAALEGVPYKPHKATLIPLETGWHFALGSFGLCPLGDGRWYFAKQRRQRNPATQKAEESCDATLFQWSGAPDAPFREAGD
ncbi:MAG: hypothetical protein J5871_06340 [Bacteroidales bacterium]|nr:hypothetical protein [Bacteroidales bacterium]